MGALPNINDPVAAADKSVPNLRFLPTLAEPEGRSAEAIRALRTHVITQHIQIGHRALAICAASANVGCTFVAANLAVALSQVGVNTLLIDCDLRRPAIDQIFQRASSREGLQQCLVSRDSQFGEFIEPEVLPKLSVLFAGGAAANPQELLASDQFEKLMDFCLRGFDATILDTPPANQSSDVSRVGNVVSYCLIIARRNKSFVNDVKLLANQLKADRTHLIGTVFNDA